MLRLRCPKIGTVEPFYHDILYLNLRRRRQHVQVIEDRTAEGVQKRRRWDFSRSSIAMKNGWEAIGIPESRSWHGVQAQSCFCVPRGWGKVQDCFRNTCWWKGSQPAISISIITGPHGLLIGIFDLLKEETTLLL